MKTTDPYCLLVREGTSDDGLVAPLEALLVELGCRPLIQPLASKHDKATASMLRQIIDEGQQPDIVFIHRDADNQGYQTRYEEITTAGNDLQCLFDVVPVIPIKMTEAWVLHALHNANYLKRIHVDLKGIALPPPRQIPKIAAKERLRDIHRAWATQQGRSGRRANKRRFEADRSMWVANITDTRFLDGCESFDTIRHHLQELGWQK